MNKSHSATIINID